MHIRKAIIKKAVDPGSGWIYYTGTDRLGTRPNWSGSIMDAEHFEGEADAEKFLKSRYGEGDLSWPKFDDGCYSIEYIIIIKED